MSYTERVVSQNTFSRSLINDAKAGAYYTDLPHVKSLAKFFSYPQEDEVCCFDSSAGDGAALKAFTAECPNRKLFVNDIQPETARDLKAQGCYEAVVCSDYLTAFECKNSFFTLFWANPPYGEDVAKHERYEKLFVEKMYSHLAKGAAGVFVVPQYVLVDEKFARILLARYDIKHVFKFREPVYQQFKQTAIICVRKAVNGYSKEDLEAYMLKCQNLEDLPEDYDGEKIEVLPSSAEKLTTFGSRVFEPDRWSTEVSADRSLDAFIGEAVGTRHFTSTVKYRPPINLSESHLAMQATCGIGAGAVGSEEEGNYHLQRGSVRRKKDEQVRPKKNGKNGEMEIVEVDHASITIKVAQQIMGEDGRPELLIQDLM
jgi:hypothetical protein